MQLTEITLLTPNKVLIRPDSAAKRKSVVPLKSCRICETLDIVVYKQRLTFGTSNLIPYFRVEI